MKRFIITGVDTNKIRINIYKNKRSFSSLAYAEKEKRKMEDYYTEEVDLKCEEVEVLTIKELQSQIESLKTQLKREKDCVDGLLKVVKSAHSAICFDARDFSTNKTDSWLYAILVGWDDGLLEVARIHNWSDETVQRLIGMRIDVENARETVKAREE